MKTIIGDITTCTSGVLLNGVNCKRKMGSGVALAYLKKWPVVKSQYLITQPELGKLDMVRIQTGVLYVANCYTQRGYGYDGAQYADYAALFESVYHAALEASAFDLIVKTPMIGGYRGGLNKGHVIKILELIEEITEVPFELFLLE